MKTRKVPGNGQAAMPSIRLRRRRERAASKEALGAEALEAAVPGSLLVLMSRLARAETPEPADDDATG